MEGNEQGTLAHVCDGRLEESWQSKSKILHDDGIPSTVILHHHLPTSSIPLQWNLDHIDCEA